MTHKYTSIKAFSSSSATENILNRLQSKSHKSRSQLIREAVDYYAKSAKTPIQNQDYHPNQVLKNYYDLISVQKSKPSIVIGIAIINYQHKVLIGQRKSQDQFVNNLSWTFPSGKFSSLDFEKEIIKTVKVETALAVNVHHLIHARLIPDSPAKKIRIVALYYHCKMLSIKITPGGDFKTLKWVPAVDITKYFTTSVSDEIMNFLGTL